jgi:hypothetical protein
MGKYERRIRAQSRKRGLPIPEDMMLLNKPIWNAHFHHSHIYDDDGRMIGGYIPVELHEKFPHQPTDEMSMAVINLEMLEWLAHGIDTAIDSKELRIKYGLD